MNTNAQNFKTIYDSLSDEDKTIVWGNVLNVCKENIFLKGFITISLLTVGGIAVYKCIKKNKRKSVKDDVIDIE